MKKEEILKKMREEKLVSVLRARDKEEGKKLVEAVTRGGIHFIEITMTMEQGNPMDFLQVICENYRNREEIVIGAGTVLDPETAREAILAGAQSVSYTHLASKKLASCEIGVKSLMQSNPVSGPSF